ncbi:MAG TPA: hypothetical protein VHY08_21070, partial [Bacillota bacterium]|nr:hypothetical protein [Bacillota bacterium]
MRLVESLLLLANLLTFLGFMFSRPRFMRWLRYSAPITLLIAITQVAVEGWRWQMVPAYTLTGTFFLVWLLQNRTLTGISAVGKGKRRLVYGLGILGMTVSMVL